MMRCVARRAEVSPSSRAGCGRVSYESAPRRPARACRPAALGRSDAVRASSYLSQRKLHRLSRARAPLTLFWSSRRRCCSWLLLHLPASHRPSTTEHRLPSPAAGLSSPLHKAPARASPHRRLHPPRRPPSAHSSPSIESRPHPAPPMSTLKASTSKEKDDRMNGRRSASPDHDEDLSSSPSRSSAHEVAAASEKRRNTGRSTASKGVTMANDLTPDGAAGSAYPPSRPSRRSRQATRESSFTAPPLRERLVRPTLSPSLLLSSRSYARRADDEPCRPSSSCPTAPSRTSRPGRRRCAPSSSRAGSTSSSSSSPSAGRSTSPTRTTRVRPLLSTSPSARQQLKSTFSPRSAVVFVFTFLAIIPLAKLLGYGTEELALRVGQTLGGRACSSSASPREGPRADSGLLLQS